MNSKTYMNSKKIVNPLIYLYPTLSLAITVEDSSCRFWFELESD
jgi:hypothetical protein